MQVFGFSLILYLLNKFAEKDCIKFPLNKAHFQKAMSKKIIFLFLIFTDHHLK